MGNGWRQRKSARKNAESLVKLPLEKLVKKRRKLGRMQGSSSVSLKTSGKKTPSHNTDEGALNQTTKKKVDGVRVKYITVGV